MQDAWKSIKAMDSWSEFDDWMNMGHHQVLDSCHGKGDRNAKKEVQKQAHKGKLAEKEVEGNDGESEADMILRISKRISGFVRKSAERGYHTPVRNDYGGVGGGGGDGSDWRRQGGGDQAGGKGGNRRKGNGGGGGGGGGGAKGGKGGGKGRGGFVGAMDQGGQQQRRPRW